MGLLYGFSRGILGVKTNYSLNSFKVVIYGITEGSILMGVIKGDTRS